MSAGSTFARTENSTVPARLHALTDALAALLVWFQSVWALGALRGGQAPARTDPLLATLFAFSARVPGAAFCGGVQVDEGEVASAVEGRSLRAAQHRRHTARHRRTQCRRPPACAGRGAREGRVAASGRAAPSACRRLSRLTACAGRDAEVHFRIANLAGVRPPFLAPLAAVDPAPVPPPRAARLAGR